ncbi:hypothetical protein [Geminocystis sp. NIES-3709]|uniref:hypothetical protein n=1 Tax=Geminocystis sp. NIES-3709 TaxID=1617448 RepID=UPI0005FC79AA|nr:hypothetical protein [Geminocystis sp. NIES-3709]BAQ63770.1 hypothetical protein GM3709_535 [Geminocystis sp. NIES-3709]
MITSEIENSPKRYRMFLDNSRTGNRYTLTLEESNGEWIASWYSTILENQRVEGSDANLVAINADQAFHQAKYLIEKEDEDIIGVDWQFENPLPPWIVD